MRSPGKPVGVGSGFSHQREKTLALDNTLLVVGSLNATSYSAHICEEAMVFTGVADTVEEHLRHAPEIWTESVAVPNSFIDRPRARPKSLDHLECDGAFSAGSR